MKTFLVSLPIGDVFFDDWLAFALKFQYFKPFLVLTEIDYPSDISTNID